MVLETDGSFMNHSMLEQNAAVREVPVKGKVSNTPEKEPTLLGNGKRRWLRCQFEWLQVLPPGSDDTCVCDDVIEQFIMLLQGRLFYDLQIVGQPNTDR